MNASIVKRSVVILGAIAIPWVGCALWSSHLEQAEKDALAAEIRVEIAARPRWPDRTAERRDFTAEYDAILAGLGNTRDSDELARVLADPFAWRSDVPSRARSDLAAHGAALAALDALAAKGDPGWMRCFGGDRWRPWKHLRVLLAARGRASIVQGDWFSLLQTIRALRRAADDALASFVLPGQPEPAGTAGGFEDEVFALLAIAAVDAGLYEQAAVELLAVSGGPSVRGEAFDAIREWRRTQSDEFCLNLLGPAAQEAMAAWGIPGADSFLDRVGRILPGGKTASRDGPVAPPSTPVLREMRGIQDRFVDAERRRDSGLLALGGEFDREVARDLGGRWTGTHAGAYPVWSRFRWRMEARLPVLRAALAIRIHEHRTGRAPGTLAELVPSILDAVPVDAWTGKPVVFTPGPGAGWLVEAGPPQASFDHSPGATETTKPYQLQR